MVCRLFEGKPKTGATPTYRLWCPLRYQNQNTSTAKWMPFLGLSVLTHWGREKMADIFQTTFKNAFSWVKMLKFRLKCHWSLFLRFQLTTFQHWRRAGDNSLSEAMIFRLLTNICVTRPQWVNHFACYQNESVEHKGRIYKLWSLVNSMILYAFLYGKL